MTTFEQRQQWQLIELANSHAEESNDLRQASSVLWVSGARSTWGSSARGSRFRWASIPAPPGKPWRNTTLTGNCDRHAGGRKTL